MSTQLTLVRRFARGVRIITLLLSVVAVIYGLIWLVIGIIGIVNGSIIDVLIYFAVVAFAATPMIAYWFAGLILHENAAPRRTALMGIGVLSPAVLIWAGLMNRNLRYGHGDQKVIMIVGIPGVLSLLVAALFIAIIVMAPRETS